MTPATSNLFDQLLDPVTQCFTPAVAQQVADLRLSNSVQVKLECSCAKANEETLSTEERNEYEVLIETCDFISALQAKSRRLLKESEAGDAGWQGTRLSASDRERFLELLDCAAGPQRRTEKGSRQVHPTSWLNRLGSLSG